MSLRTRSRVVHSVRFNRDMRIKIMRKLSTSLAPVPNLCACCDLVPVSSHAALRPCVAPASRAAARTTQQNGALKNRLCDEYGAREELDKRCVYKRVA